MTEYQIEQLEKMFPNGFIIVANQPNGFAHAFVGSKEENEADYDLWECYEVIREYLDDECDECDDEEDAGEEWKRGVDKS